MPRAVARACESNEGAADERWSEFGVEPELAAGSDTEMRRAGRDFISAASAGVPGWAGAMLRSGVAADRGKGCEPGRDWVAERV